LKGVGIRQAMCTSADVRNPSIAESRCATRAKQRCGAQERTRTFTAVQPLAPEACASTNSATWALGRFLLIVRRACQIAAATRRGLYQRLDRNGVSRKRGGAAAPRRPLARDSARGSQPMLSPHRYARHGLRRVRFSRPACHPGAGQARLSHPGRVSAARNWRATCSRWAGSARFTPCRPMCAIRPRFRPPPAAPASWSIWSGFLPQSGAQTFEAVQDKGAETVAQAAAGIGARMVHVSAIGADANSTSAYARTKAAGEAAVLAAVPDATSSGPSVVFGPEDQFTNRFAALARLSPVLPLIGGGLTKLQPVYRRRRRHRHRGCGRWQGAAGRDLRTRRSRSDDPAGDHRRHSEDHPARAHAGAAAVRPRQAEGGVPAVRAGPTSS
jgi:hypothetical protein